MVSITKISRNIESVLFLSKTMPSTEQEAHRMTAAQLWTHPVPRNIGRAKKQTPQV